MSNVNNVYDAMNKFEQLSSYIEKMRTFLNFVAGHNGGPFLINENNDWKIVEYDNYSINYLLGIYDNGMQLEMPTLFFDILASQSYEFNPSPISLGYSDQGNMRPMIKFDYPLYLSAGYKSEKFEDILKREMAE